MDFFWGFRAVWCGNSWVHIPTLIFLQISHSRGDLLVLLTWEDDLGRLRATEAATLARWAILLSFPNTQHTFYFCENGGEEWDVTANDRVALQSNIWRISVWRCCQFRTYRNFELSVNFKQKVNATAKETWIPWIQEKILFFWKKNHLMEDFTK